MCERKFCVNLLLIAAIIRSGHLISVGPGPGSPTDSKQWIARQVRVSRKQNSLNEPSEFQLHPERFSQFLVESAQKSYKNAESTAKQRYSPQSYGIYKPRPSRYHPKPPPALPPGYQNHQQGFVEALNSITQNDRLQCVPRLLCEFVSSPSSEKTRELNLPFNLDLSSLLALLPYLIQTGSSPLLEFGRAALLGYTSKGSADVCLQSYPDCPKNPEQLVEYLNNYNGGFFRFFNGRPQKPYQSYYTNPNRRIQNKPVRYVDSSFNNKVKFPNLVNELENGGSGYSQDDVFYESDDYDYPYPTRQAKGIAFPNIVNEFNSNKNWNKAIPMVFPDRTGTGEFKFDSEDFGSSSNYLTY